MLPILTDAIDRNAQDYAREPSDTDEREWQGYCDRGSCCLELNHEGKCKQ
jgi:hypothetical protein